MPDNFPREEMESVVEALGEVPWGAGWLPWEEYDKYTAAGGKKSYWDWWWAGWPTGPTPMEGLATPTAEALSIIAGVPGLQEAMDEYQRTGDRSQVQAIMDALEANDDAAHELAGTLGGAVRSEVQTISGMMFVVSYDAEGNMLPFYVTDFLGEAPPMGLTPWQQSQVDNWANTVALQRSQLDWQIEQWGQELGLSREELNLQREQFEAQMGLSRDQFEFQKEQFKLEMGIAQEQIDIQREQLGLSREQLGWQREAEAARLALEEKQHLAGLKARPGAWIEAYQFEHEAAPPAPSWLPEYAPGTAAGAPITREGVKTPSAQAYGKMPWGQREMLGGFAEFANVPGAPQNITEIGERVGGMLPQERTRQARWQPAYQV